MLPVIPKVPKTILSSHKEKGKLKKEVKKYFFLPKASEKREWWRKMIKVRRVGELVWGETIY